jgi:adenylosuccinate synthase
MKVDVLLGLQWGDEGKGKIVDVLAPQYDIVARFQGGPNAGHTIIFDDKKFVLHTIPSGIFYKDIINVIGNGVIIDPYSIMLEINNLESYGFDVRANLLISRRAHLILPSHRLLDAFNEKQKGKEKIGSTLKGIGPTYTDKTGRNGLRIGDMESQDFKTRYLYAKRRHLEFFDNHNFDYRSVKIDGLFYEEYEKRWFESIEILKSFQFVNSEYYLNNSLSQGKNILAEGAQGSMLDVEFGTYPFVTSSNTTIGGVATGLGIPPQKIDRIFGIFKAYTTRVGNGPFPTELFDEDGEQMRKTGQEFGATTGRPRRCGWLDLVALRYAVMLNGVTDLFMMKVDVLNGFEKIKLSKQYTISDMTTDEFPLESENIIPVYETNDGWNAEKSNNDQAGISGNLKKYIQNIENYVKVPIKAISTGPERNQIIYLNKY